MSEQHPGDEVVAVENGMETRIRLRTWNRDAAEAKAVRAGGEKLPMNRDRVPEVKLVLLGPQGSGKTCLATRFSRGEYDAETLPTIGAAFVARAVAGPSGSTVAIMQCWDTSGDDRYASLLALYTRGAQVLLFTFDSCDASSLERLGATVERVNAASPPEHCIKVLVATKCDKTAERVVSAEVALKRAEQLGVPHYCEVSAAANVGVEALFSGVAHLALRTFPH